MTQQEEKILERFKEMATSEARTINHIYDNESSISRRKRYYDNVFLMKHGYFMACSTINKQNNFKLYDMSIIGKELDKIMLEIMEEILPKESK